MAVATPSPAEEVKRRKSEAKTEAEVRLVNLGEITFWIRGRTPLILNRLSEKAKRTLLFPEAPLNKAARGERLKHNPVQEFRASPYRLRGEDAQTLLAMPAMSFKNAIASVAMDVPGLFKSQVGRLVYVESDYIPLFGTPQLFMAVVRDAGQNHSPDIRTRAIVPNWACKLTVTYADPAIAGKNVINLLGNAGTMRGVGDWRAEKGKGNYGQFDLVNEGDERWQAIIAHGGREAQVAALEKPVCYDLETEDLFTWFEEELDRRDKRALANAHEVEVGEDENGEEEFTVLK